MTKLSYPFGWSAGSKVRGKASSPSDYAWIVNFNNGNANWNNQSNDGFVRAVRVSECQGATPLQDLHAAWREARRGKRPSGSQLKFELFWIDSLLALQDEINSLRWRPAPPTCFVAHLPKAREIHAPKFRDRVVHHWLVPKLEAIYEPLFIFDSFSNRVGKGTHAAIDRLEHFVREVHSGQGGGGWYLQLDVRNFFNSIHRPTLYALLRERMTRHALPIEVRAAVKALLRYSPVQDGVIYACTPEERARIPLHKRLENAAPGCGIAIGNLSSQFFANVYLNELDQFIKHTLRARRYIRYVDDFVIVHESREQLATWRAEIESFLERSLRLSLKDAGALRPLTSGVDFLGYIVKPTHRVVRRRVVHHAGEKLDAWASQHVSQRLIRATPQGLREVQSIWRSYEGHFSHAASSRLIRRFHERFEWLSAAIAPRSFDYRLEGQRLSISRSAA